MSFAEHFRIATEKEKTEAVARLVKASTGDFDFYMFAFFGILMASMGLILDTPEVIIGGMLIAPVLYPLLSLSLSLVISDLSLMYRSLRTMAVSFGISILLSLALALLLRIFMDDFTLGEQVAARARPSLIFFIVAFISGLGASYALIHASLNELLPGVAISVSLVPPLAVVGIALGAGSPEIAGKAFLLFLLNVVGIVFASLITFSLIDLHSTRKIAQSAVRQEDKRLEQENEKIEEIKQHHETF